MSSNIYYESESDYVRLHISYLFPPHPKKLKRMLWYVDDDNFQVGQYVINDIFKKLSLLRLKDTI